MRLQVLPPREGDVDVALSQLLEVFVPLPDAAQHQARPGRGAGHARHQVGEGGGQEVVTREPEDLLRRRCFEGGTGGGDLRHVAEDAARGRQQRLRARREHHAVARVHQELIARELAQHV